MPLRLGQTGQRIHQQQDPHPGVSEKFPDRGRKKGAAYSHERRLIRSGDYDHRAAEPFRSQILLQKFFDLATALANQGDNIDVGLGIAADHSQHHALADTASRKDTDLLTAATGQEPIDRANTKIQRFCDPRPPQRIHRLGI